MSFSAGIDKAPAPLTGVRRMLLNLARWLALPVRPRRVAAVRLLPPTLRLLAGGALGVVLVALAMVLLDARATAFAGRLPPGVVATFNEITDFGQSKWFLVPIGAVIVVAAVFATQATGRMSNLVLTSLIVRLEFVFVAISVPGLFVAVIKRLIGRVRPSELGPFAYMPWSWKPAYASLPSGHTTSAIAAAVAIGLIWPKARIPIAIFACAIALSRVVIQAHFVSDVIAAVFVSAFGAILVRNWFAARGLAFVAHSDGTIHALPGPSWRRLKTVARKLAGQ